MPASPPVARDRRRPSRKPRQRDPRTSPPSPIALAVTAASADPSQAARISTLHFIFGAGSPSGPGAPRTPSPAMGGGQPFVTPRWRRQARRGNERETSARSPRGRRWPVDRPLLHLLAAVAGREQKEGSGTWRQFRTSGSRSVRRRRGTAAG